MMFWRRLFQPVPYQTLNQITLSSAALTQNLDAFQRLAPTSHIAPVLKSNAYGHGVIEIARMIDRQNHAQRYPFLIVDSLYEAYQLQLARITTPILIMGFTIAENFRAKKVPFSTVVYDLNTIQALHRYQPHMPLHLKIDTGMNRQGVQLRELASFLDEVKKIKGIKIDGVCTHFADADNKKSTAATERQLRLFDDALLLIEQKGFHPRWKHAAATAGALIAPAVRGLNMIRLGLGLYGISPFPIALAGQPDIQPILQLESTISSYKEIERGDAVGYNGTYIAEEPRRIAILPLGYFEGVDRRLSNQGCVTVRDIPCPIIGRVSMNMTIIDVTAVPQINIGEKVIVYSRIPSAPNSIQAAAATARTIPYELLVHLSPSIKRITI